MRDLSGNYVESLDSYDEDLDEPQEEIGYCGVFETDADILGTCCECGRDYCEECEGESVGFQCCKWCAEDMEEEDDEF